MNHREGPNLPSGNRLATMAHPPPPSQIPQYLSGDQFNTSSTDSQDSFTTQVPHSFHSAASDGNFAVQDQKQQNNAYVSAFVGSNVPFATPQIVSNSAFLSLRSMNPNSAEFKPVGPPSNNGSNNSTEPASFNTSFESNASSGYQSSMGSGFQTQIGDTSYYGTPTPYGNISVAGNTGAQYIDDYGIVVNPRLESYGPYPAATTSGNFDAYNPHSGTQAYTAQSPAMGYYNGNTSYQGAAYGGIHPSGYQNGQVTQYNSHSNQYVAQPIYHNPANANRGKPINTRGNSNLRAHNQRSSNLATAPVMNPLHQGGPVHPPSTSHGPPSPSKSRASDCSTLTSEVKSEFETSTPAQVTRHLEFRSEPHGAKTPTQLLRSRRGQNISTDRKPNTGIWLDGIPSAEVIPSESQMLRGSPPKMGSLSLVGPLTPIGPDPFVSSTPGFKRPFNNPFCQTPQQLSPFNGSNASGHQNNGPSAALMSLTAGCTRKPTLGEAMNSKNLPFAEYCRLAKEDSWGVIRIKNIPYAVTRPEILAFLGRNARIISDIEYEPVHIVMERVTSKTLDAYVEFVNFNEAVNAVNRFEVNRSGGRGGRLGQRHVEVELSCQERLMQDLFPKAKNVKWRGARPVIEPVDPEDKYNSGFQGFISKEELVMLIKHVEAPQRSPFSKDCPQRPYECIISTLLKYPWFMVEYITIEDRNLLHEVTLKLIVLLQEKLQEVQHDSNLTPMLFRRVCKAALKCPGFSPAQKDDIVVLAGLDERIAAEYGVPPLAADWKYIFTLAPKPGFPLDIVFYYAALIREATEKKQHLTLAEKAAKGVEDIQPKLFGELGVYVGLPHNHDTFIHMSLGQVGAKEWAGIEQVLRQALVNDVD